MLAVFLDKMNRAQTRNGKHKSPDQRSDLKVPAVYFDLVIFPELPSEQPRIKIGSSDDHEKRRRQHNKTHFGIKVNVEHLCVVRGTVADERQVQKHFGVHLIDCEEETFWPHNDLVDYIRWLRDQWFTWVPDDEQCPPLEQFQTVNSCLWMPTIERRKKAPQQTNMFTPVGILNLPPRELTVDDFYTNEVIIEAARRTLGEIDLDPASHAVANRIVKARRFYTSTDDGLSRQWAGCVWLNPPFSQWQLWVPKIVEEWKSGRIVAMCLLCATRTLTAQYFAGIHENCASLCVLYGRIPFWGGRAATPDDGHAIFYFGHDAEAFRREFGELGNVYTR